jgi:hypothetical protein
VENHLIQFSQEYNWSKDMRENIKQEDIRYNRIRQKRLYVWDPQPSYNWDWAEILK